MQAGRPESVARALRPEAVLAESRGLPGRRVPQGAEPEVELVPPALRSLPPAVGPPVREAQVFPLEVALPGPVPQGLLLLRGARGPELALRVQAGPVQEVAPLEFLLKAVLSGPEVARRQHPPRVE